MLRCWRWCNPSRLTFGHLSLQYLISTCCGGGAGGAGGASHPSKLTLGHLSLQYGTWLARAAVVALVSLLTQVNWLLIIYPCSTWLTRAAVVALLSLHTQVNWHLAIFPCSTWLARASVVALVSQPHPGREPAGLLLQMSAQPSSFLPCPKVQIYLSVLCTSIQPAILQIRLWTIIYM